MRNVLVHNYFNVDRDIVWRVVHHDLRPLKVQIRALLDEIDARNPKDSSPEPG